MQVEIDREDAELMLNLLMECSFNGKINDLEALIARAKTLRVRLDAVRNPKED